jgi:hypothetical protein
MSAYLEYWREQQLRSMGYLNPDTFTPEIEVKKALLVCDQCERRGGKKKRYASRHALAIHVGRAHPSN